jgi:hypothetical protein
MTKDLVDVNSDHANIGVLAHILISFKFLFLHVRLHWLIFSQILGSTADAVLQS